ncbi:MAG: DUF3347 domain-containing protein [Lacibacter sp.]
MRKLLFITASFLFLAACKNKSDKKDETTDTVVKESTASTYSDSFKRSVNQALSAYFQLKDAFVESDTVKVNAAGNLLKTILDSLKLNEVQKNDSLGYESIAGRPGDAVAEITGMTGEKELDKKRESFEMISNVFYDMVRVIKPAGTTVYYQFCPMAFDNKGAYWLSNTDSIRNPYFGSKMLTCGETKETLVY